LASPTKNDKSFFKLPVDSSRAAHKAPGCDICIESAVFADYDQITFNSCTKYELFLALMEELFPWQGQITLTCPTTLLLSFKQLYRHCH
jgi:hypothetical protein